MDKLLLALILATQVLFLSSCGNGNGEDNSDTAPDSDGDEDGLTYKEETEVYFTSPTLADTDGDGISDGDEVNELGFNSASNPYRFNPLIADLPGIGINIETVPELVLRFTDSSGTEHEFSNSTGGEEVVIDTRSHTGGVSVMVGTEVGVEIGTGGTSADSKVTASVTGSYSTTEEHTTENHETWEEVTTDSNFSSRDTDSASIRVGVSIENNSNLSYSLDHISLLGSYVQGDASSKPIATLSYDNSGGGFQRTSFAPGEKSNLLLFSFDDLDLGTALDILKDTRNMIVEPALFELVNADGVPIAFDEGEVDAKTAGVIIDYGITRPQEFYDVAVLGSHGEGSLTVDIILGSILNAEYVDNGGITEVRGVGGETDSRWMMLVTHHDGFVDTTTIYDIEDASYDITSVDIFPGDQLNFVYLTDVDGDGIGIREEVLNGTDPNNPDTDGDGLTDDIEIRSLILVNAINLIDPNRYPALVKSNPVLADADGDLLTDLEEIDRGLDPNNADTDGDGISDKIDSFNGQIPIAANFVVTPQGGGVIGLAGIATPKNGTRVESINVDWGDGSPVDGISSTTSAPLSLNISHTYTLTPGLDSETFAITMTMQSTDDDPISPNIVNVMHAGSFELFNVNTLSEFDTGSGWFEDKNIRTLADMDDDGDLDLVGFGSDGVYVSLWDESSSPPEFGVVTPWITGIYGSDAPGGSYNKIDHPRHLVDFDQDGLTDIVAFGQGETFWSKNCGDNTFKAAAACGDPVNTQLFESLTGNYSFANGWRTEQHVRAIVDVDGNGFPDIVGIGASAVFINRNNGPDSNGSISLTQLSMDGTTNTALEQGYGTAFTSGDAGATNLNSFRLVKDINDDGRADLVLSGGSRIIYSLGQADGSFSAIGEICTSSGPCFTPAQGWTPSKHLIFLEDMNNDGSPDLVGFSNGTVYVSLNKSVGNSISFDSNFKSWSSDYVYNTGWRIGTHERYLADFDGDGFNDIIGFTGTAIASLNLFPAGEEKISSNISTLSTDFGLDANWQSGGLFNSRIAGDYNNDGRADVVGFSNTGVIGQRSPIIVQPTEQ